MKNYIYRIVKLFVLSLVLFSCDKDADVITSFDFEFAVTAEEKATINFPLKTSLAITTERQVINNIYSFSYELLSGDGVFVDKEGNEIAPNTLIPLSKLNEELRYKGKSVRDNKDKVKIIVSDSEGREKEQIIEYEIIQNEYSFNVASSTLQTNVNDDKVFSVSIINTGVDKSVTYERAIFITKGKGTITNSEGESLQLDKFVSATSGIENINVSFSEFGESEIKVITRDSNGFEKEEVIQFQVNQVLISFTAVAEKNNPFISEEIDINFALSEEDGSSSGYELSYTVEQGNITLKSNGETLDAGINNAVSLGEFNWQASSNVGGQVDITFNIRNSSGSKLSVPLTITFQDGSFSFTATPASNEASINGSITFNNLITETGPVAQPYSLRYTSTNTGIVVYNGTNYAPGEIIPNISTTTFSFDYTGLVEGSHELVFTLENANGIPMSSDPVILTYTKSDYNFIGSAEANDVTLNTPINLNFNIEEIDLGQNFRMRYEIDSGDFDIIDNGSPRNAGILYSVNSGEFSWTLTPTSTNNIKISFFVVNDVSITKRVDINLGVVDVAFDFTILGNGNIQTANVSDLELDLTGAASQTYKLSYNISPRDGSRLLNRGSEILQNSDLNIGKFPVRFDFKNDATYTIEFIVTSTSGESKPKSKQVVVSNTPFVINATGASNSIINNAVGLSLALSGNPNLSYTVNYSIVSGGGSVTLPNNSNLPQGTRNFSFTPNRTGTNTIRFTVTDNFGFSRVVNKSVTVRNNPPTVTGIGGGNVTPLGVSQGLQPRHNRRDRRSTNGGNTTTYTYTSFIDIPNISINSALPITAYRFRNPNNSLSSERGYNPSGGTLSIPNNNMKITDTFDEDGGPNRTSFDYSQANFKRTQNPSMSIQFKAQDGQWSNFVNVTLLYARDR